MTIYLIEHEEFAYETNSGRDEYEFRIDPDLGYFTARESAQDRIVKLCTPKKETFKINEALRKKEWQRAKDKWDEHEKTIAVLKENGLPVPRDFGWGIRNPGQFIPKTFDPAPVGMESYNVVEVEPGG